MSRDSRPHVDSFMYPMNGAHPYCRQQTSTSNAYDNAQASQNFERSSSAPSCGISSVNSLDKAIEDVISAFRSHAEKFGSVDVIEALEEFWRLKADARNLSENEYAPPVYDNDIDCNYFLGVPDKNGHTYNIRVPDSESLIRYEYGCDADVDRNSLHEKELTDDLHEKESNHGEVPWACYVFLPGGSCFASRGNCYSRSEAQHSAAKIALMNSIFNEHPSRRITLEYVEQMLTTKAVTGRMDSVNLRRGCQLSLEFMVGKTFMEYLDFCTVLRLICWAGSLSEFFGEECSTSKIFLYCYEVVIDAEFRWRLALQLVEKERQESGFLVDSISSAKDEIRASRCAGKELRFPLEKVSIGSLALQQLRCGNIT
ncbi:protein limb expression 1 homolog [Paramacrobiotus metropolitanus]|uniref:protein limb expression 1 homolog n=1 Tax=Paramacrobiotus metropolitanus TaxID=2943436 RepID=UPI002445E641|nr:protein limb expression 1 homolog [Paramacrobiotus metropolitanus]